MEHLIKEAKAIIRIRVRGYEIVQLKNLVSALEAAIDSGDQTEIQNAHQALEKQMIERHNYAKTLRRMQQMQNCDEYGNPMDFCED